MDSGFGTVASISNSQNCDYHLSLERLDETHDFPVYFVPRTMNRWNECADLEQRAALQGSVPDQPGVILSFQRANW